MGAVLRAAPWYIYATIIVSLGLVVAGFCVPPQGVIDGSVLTAIGEMMGGVAVLDFVINIPNYIREGAKAKIEHGNTTITIGKKPEEVENADAE